MSAPDYDRWFEEETRTWYVSNMTKWGTVIVAEFHGLGAELWSKKYYEWLWEQERGGDSVIQEWAKSGE